MDRPTGTLTLLFTDIEGSTRLLQQLGASGYSKLLADHHRLMRAAISACQGVEVKTEGDSFFAVFSRATPAVTAALTAQSSLAEHEFAAPVAVRMGIHSGEVEVSNGEYVGIDIHRAARIGAAAHGGQIVISEVTRALVGSNLPAEAQLRDLGEHRLRDFDEPTHLFQLTPAGLPADFPPLRSLSARLHILPTELTPLVGRERELERAAQLLAGTRLLTLTGPGGTGKTRLSLALARRVADEFADGAAFVELAAIQDPDLVPTAVRHGLGFREEPGRPATETIVANLGGRHVLLVLDNFEQVLGAAGLVRELLARTERVSVVVTSRATLHLEGEQEMAVPPLGVPDGSQVPDLDRLAANEAVALFIQRARAADAGFSITPQNAAPIVEICRRLDGLPLAIELAASRIKVLPPAAILTRLERSLDVLQTAAVDRADRQRTLRGAIEWSYELLDPTTQRLFRTLAGFVGGFDIESAGWVAAATGHEGDTLDGLTSLVDQSLVRRVAGADETRFSLLETIREFGLEKLAREGERDAVGNAHAKLFLDMTVALEPEFTRGEDAVDRVERDHDNVRAALRWAAEHGQVEQALRSAGALWRFWQFRGHLREGRRTTEALLALTEASAPTRGRLAALNGLGGLLYWQDEFARCEAVYGEALALARELGDVAGQAEQLYNVSHLRQIAGDYAATESMLLEAADLYRSLDDVGGVARTKALLGHVASLQGRYEEALPLIRDAIALLRSQGDVFYSLNYVIAVVIALLKVGDHEAARRELKEFITAQRERGDMTAVSLALFVTAAFAALTERYELAARLLGAMEGLHDRIGGQAPLALLAPVDPTRALEAKLDARDRERAMAEGRLLDDLGAISLALETLEAPVGTE